jgi:hypothetical protein
MEIDDTIQTLAKVRRSIDTRSPQKTTHPDALIADLNDLYVDSAKNRDLDEVFRCDDVGSPSITLTIRIDMEFDLLEVTKGMRTKLQALRPIQTDEIEKAGVVWSHGRYDFVYDCDSGTLRVSHKYSHRRTDTKSISSIAKQMIDYAIGYLEEVSVSARRDASAAEADPIRLPRESRA